MSSTDEAAKSFYPLSEVLRGRRTAALTADAELIRDAPNGDERDQEARRAIREAMLLFTLRRITRTERDRVLDILSFVTVRDIAHEPELPPPLAFDQDEPDGSLP